MKKSTVATAAVSTAVSTDEAMDILRMAHEGVAEEAPPASEERPSLHLVSPPAVTEEPLRSSVARLIHRCPECESDVSDLPGVWSEKYGKCCRCAAPLIRKAEQKMWFCACGNRKLNKDFDLCVPCHKDLLKKQAAEREAAKAARLVCPNCGGEKEWHLRVCPTCYSASRPAPAPQAQQPRKSTRPGVPEYKVDPKAQKRAEERNKLGQALLGAHRAGTLDKSFPGAKATKDEADSAQVCLSYNGESYTLIDQAKVKAIAERKAEAAKAAQAAQAEAAKKAAEARKAAAALAKANKSNQPKKGKKDKSSESSAKPTKAERKAARKGK